MCREVIHRAWKICHKATDWRAVAVVAAARCLPDIDFLDVFLHPLIEGRHHIGAYIDPGELFSIHTLDLAHDIADLLFAADYAELNGKLRAGCLKRQHARLRGQTETIAERLIRDRQALMALPAVPFDPCHKVATRVSSLSLVRYRRNDYSVPTEYGHREVLVKGYVERVEISCHGEIIAVHRRSFGNEDFICDPIHYLALLEHKPRAFEQAAPLQHWALPEVFDRLRRLLEARMDQRGRKEYLQVLRLLETFDLAQVERGIQQALSLDAPSVDAVKHLILCALEQRPAKLNLTLYPYLPEACVRSMRLHFPGSDDGS